MTYTLRGRIQTRLVLIATVGVAWTWLVTPFIPSSSLSQMGMANSIMTKFMTTIPIGPQQSLLFVNYQMGFETIGVMAGLGIVWELIYHGLQQIRWDRDWPPVFTLLAVVPEGVALWYGAHALGVFPAGPWGLSSPEMEMYVIHLVTVWVVLWLATLGPLRVVAPRWRFTGGEFWRRPSANGQLAGLFRARKRSGLLPNPRGPAGPAAPAGERGGQVLAKSDLISQQ